MKIFFGKINFQSVSIYIETKIKTEINLELITVLTIILFMAFFDERNLLLLQFNGLGKSKCQVVSIQIKTTAKIGIDYVINYSTRIILFMVSFDESNLFN